MGVLRRVAGLALVLEGFSTGLSVASRIPRFPAYSSVVLTLLLVRGILAPLQFSSGWLVWRRHPLGVLIGRPAVVASAILLILELGFALAPSSIFPAYRWPAVGFYWLYAVALFGILTRSR